MKSITSFLLLTCVAAHAVLQSPPNRSGGAAYAKACGSTIAAQDKSDATQEVQTLGKAPDASCDLFLCKGYKFEDVAASDVQRYKLGQKIDFVYDLTIPHAGMDPTNVTIIDMKKRQVISENLFFADTLGAEQKKLTLPVVLPTAMKSGTNPCTTPGDCVLALNWDAKKIDQTFRKHCSMTY